MTSNPAALSRSGGCGSRTVEFLMRDAEVSQDGSDGSRFQLMAAPVGDGRPAAVRRSNPDLVVAAGASIQVASESAQLTRELAVPQTATMTSPRPSCC